MKPIAHNHTNAASNPWTARERLLAPISQSVQGAGFNRNTGGKANKTNKAG